MRFLFLILMIIVIIYKLVKELSRTAPDADLIDPAKVDSWIKRTF